MEKKEDSFPKIFVVGEKQAGKTSLVNALIHQELLHCWHPAAPVVRLSYDKDTNALKISDCHIEGGNFVVDKERLFRRSRKDEAKRQVYSYERNAGFPYILNGSFSFSIYECAFGEMSKGIDAVAHALGNTAFFRQDTMILYVAHAAALHTVAEQRLLSLLGEWKRKQYIQESQVQFIMNKCDLLGMGNKNSIASYFSSAWSNLKTYGFENPVRIPISAADALTVHKAERQQDRSERAALYGQLTKRYLEDEGKHLERYANIAGPARMQLSKMNAQRIEGESKRMLDLLLHTGVPVVEQAIIGFLQNGDGGEKNSPSPTASHPSGVARSANDPKNTKAAPLLARDYFPEEIELDQRRLFPMVVMATMSSGKSTLINALLERDILPSSNEACTAKIYSILDKDTAEASKLYVRCRDGTVKTFDGDLEETLNSVNRDPSVTDILIVSEIRGIMNTERSLLLIDTPGPNNSLDAAHEEMALSALKKMEGGLLLYIINATQMGTKDDKRYLQKILAMMAGRRKLKIVFAVNKMDELDIEKESFSGFLSDTKAYLEEIGFQSPDIIPVSALAARLFKKAMRGGQLTRQEAHAFIGCYELFKPSAFNLLSFTETEDTRHLKGSVRVGRQEYRLSDIYLAIGNTGITYLEKYIQKAQITSHGVEGIEINLKGVV